jgi:uncharacterized protein (TIGR03032 family)
MTAPNDSVDAAMPGTTIQCAVSDGLADWLRQAEGALAISTYQSGKVILCSWDGSQINVLMRDFDKPMGLAVHGGRLALATRNEVTLFANAPLLAHDYLDHAPGRYDALYLPRVTYHTGDLNVHDLAFGRDGLVLVNSRFSCLAGVSHDACFVSRWRPPFVTDCVPEDRCHLNGLALVDGAPRYCTALGISDTPGGWRANKAAGGVLLGVPDGEVLLRGLSMPHSPRWHQGAVWLLNSGMGELCRYTPGSNGWEVVCRLPAYLRGLCCVDRWALVGLSQIREKHIFGGLPVQQQYEKLVSGVALIDLTRGVEVGRLEFTSGCTEIFETQFLPGMRRPMIVNLQQPVAREAFPTPEFSYWLRPNRLFPVDEPAPTE